MRAQLAEAVTSAVLVAHTLRGQLHDLRDDLWLALVALVGLAAATAWLIHRPNRFAASWFLVASVFWLAADGSVEGPTLLHLTRRHGLTGTDLLPLLALALWATVTTRRPAQARR